MKKILIVGLIILNILIIYLSIYFLYYCYDKYYLAPTPTINSITLDEDSVVNIKFDVEEDNLRNKIYFLYKNDSSIPNVNDSWVLTSNNEVSFKMEKMQYYAYLKNEDDKIFEIKEINTMGRVTSLTTSKQKVYIAIKGNYKVDAKYETIGVVNDTLTWYSDDESIATIDETGKIKALKKGNTKVHAKIKDKIADIDVIATDLIVVRPKLYNNKKKYLPCGKYNKEENDLLDEILKDRINDVGYKTRAATVEAARFLALEFPYKIRYFSENGRASTNGVDGEGRYYHVGLYLDSSRYKNIGKKANGPKTWGCSLYSRPSHGRRPNGLDCSGFVSWVMLNGGFDVGDIGAGLAPHLDLTDYGKRTKFNASVVSSGKVKVGDLLSSGGVNGGHIAIIAGEDDKYYYVAESLWTPPNVAVIIKPYSKKTIFNRYFYVMLMDSYYKEDGKLTKMWY